MRIGIDARFVLRKPRRGIGTYSLHLLRELVFSEPHIDFFLYVDRDDVDMTLPLAKNVHVRRLWPSPYPIWEQIALPLAASLDELDLLHCLANTAPIWVPKRMRLVLTLHDVMFLQSGEFIPLPTTTYQRVGRLYRRGVVPTNARRADAVITISEFSRKDILQLIPRLANSKVVPILEACDPYFSATSGFPARSENHPFLLCLGAQDPRKNTLRIVQAYLDAVKHHGIAHDLVISGYSNWKDSPAHSLVKSAGAEDRVHFLSFVSIEDLVKLYQQATAFLYLSLYEGFGIPILEAFACGCPVIASNITSIPEVGGDAALYVSPSDVTSIELSITRLCADAGLQADLRARGFLRAEKFSWARTARETMDVYRRVLGLSEGAAA